MRIKTCFFSTILLTVFCLNSYSASIYGYISFKNGKPVKNLKIICESTYDTFIATTDKRGYYNFTLSDSINATYFIFIETPEGKRFNAGKIPVYKANISHDITLAVDNF
jgi:hypothetical protein